MSPESESMAPKKRESRAGTRKVTSLSAEQLERKRANDRDAQRTIRQRTKEHIERLEHQVAELRAKGEQFDDVVRRNAALEQEIRALRQQLAMATGGQGYQNLAEGSYSGPSGSVLPSTQFSEPLRVNPISRAPSTRSPSLCESADADYQNRVEPYIFEGQLQPPPNAISVPPPHVPFNPPGNVHPPPNTSFQGYPHFYQPGSSSHGPVPPNPPQQLPFVQSQRPSSVPTVPQNREPGAYPILPPAQHYPHSVQPPPRNEYGYEWTHQP